MVPEPSVVLDGSYAAQHPAASTMGCCSYILVMPGEASVHISFLCQERASVHISYYARREFPYILVIVPEDLPYMLVVVPEDLP